MVQPGDTLNRIAAENRPEGVSMEQMLLALFQGNRSAFDADNMNRLQAGKILRIPDAESARQLAGGAPRPQVVAHSSDFGRYRRSWPSRPRACLRRRRRPSKAVVGGLVRRWRTGRRRLPAWLTS
jgi:pilus assembly protein FimV